MQSIIKFFTFQLIGLFKSDLSQFEPNAHFMFIAAYAKIADYLK